jgi:hypothetical protein
MTASIEEYTQETGSGELPQTLFRPVEGARALATRIQRKCGRSKIEVELLMLHSASQEG